MVPHQASTALPHPSNRCITGLRKASTNKHRHHSRSRRRIGDVWLLVSRRCAVVSCARRVASAVLSAASVRRSAARLGYGSDDGFGNELHACSGCVIRHSLQGR